MPTRKVGAGAVAGAVSALLIWAVGAFAPDAPQITPEAASSLTVLLTFVASYFVPDA